VGEIKLLGLPTSADSRKPVGLGWPSGTAKPGGLVAELTPYVQAIPVPAGLVLTVPPLETVANPPASVPTPALPPVGAPEKGSTGVPATEKDISDKSCDSPFSVAAVTGISVLNSLIMMLLADTVKSAVAETLPSCEVPEAENSWTFALAAAENTANVENRQMLNDTLNLRALIAISP